MLLSKALPFVASGIFALQSPLVAATIFTPDSQHTTSESRSLQGDLGQDLDIGSNYFRHIETLEPSDMKDYLYGISVAVSEDGSKLAVSGHESDNNGPNDSEQFRGYVDVYDMNDSYNLVYRVYTPYGKVAPDMHVDIDETGSTIAVGFVFSKLTDAATSGVAVYKLDVNSPFSTPQLIFSYDVGERGDDRGLSVSLSQDGSRLAVGSRYESSTNSGLVKIFEFIASSDSNDYIMQEVGALEGSQGDLEGSSVSISRTGAYFATGATGFEVTDKENQGAVRMYDATATDQIGDTIVGENAKDACGFGVSLVELEGGVNPNKPVLRVAVSSIFYETDSSSSNQGQVRVFEYDIGGGETVWKQLGGSMIGEYGDFIDFNEGKFHIGDSFGFALALSKNGQRAVVGSPFHSHKRQSEYYYGKIKLFQYDKDLEKWDEIANGLTGTARDSVWGYSVDFTGDGKTIAFGGSKDNVGLVSVYKQDETSDVPSAVPSSKPSALPSRIPSKSPSESPSDNPSFKPSREPSAVPSSKPSEFPSEFPSESPSESPSGIPSSKPSNKPSTPPSSKPSSRPSQVPSMKPSSIPSITPTDTQQPSQNPSFFSERLFKIQTELESFTNLDSNTQWCLETSTRTADSKLVVRPCDLSSSRQNWYLDNGKITLARTNVPGTFCIHDSGRLLSLRGCGNVINSYSFGDGMVQGNLGPIIVSKDRYDFYFGVDTLRIFSRVRLFRSGAENKSARKWKLSFEGPSDVPSELPTSSPIDVDVNNEMVNVASRGFASQSSTDGNAVASLAIDGNTVASAAYSAASDGDTTGENSLHTRTQDCAVISCVNLVHLDPWWKLRWGGALYSMSKIKIHNVDNENSARIVGFVLMIFADGEQVYSSNDPQGEFYQNSSTEKSVYEFEFENDIIGDEVKIQLLGDNKIIEMAEVEVFAYAVPTYKWVQVHQDIDGEAASDKFGHSTAMSSDGSVIIVGGLYNDGNGLNSGHVRVFRDNGINAWEQVFGDLDGENYRDYFGFSVDMSEDGTRIVVGASKNDGNGNDSGHVRVFKNNGSAWEKIHGDIDGAEKGDEAGQSVSMSLDGMRIAVGSPKNGVIYTGHVRVFEDIDDDWKLIFLTEPKEGRYFGKGVALSGNGKRVAISGGMNRGKVVVYREDGTSWQKVGDEILAVDGTWFSSNHAVSMSEDGTKLVIGSPGVGAGHARVFQDNGGYWEQLHSNIDGEASSDQFGSAVSMSRDGSKIAVGAYQNDGAGTNSGHVRVYYDDPATGWEQLYIDIDGEAPADLSGWAVSLSGDGTRLVVGAKDNDGSDGKDNSGHVRVFKNGVQ
uniref:Ricin B lectin domain-containing protein n=1 Tax=Chaetoceros debilis TaxID=122233 RepID=A0A7S3VEX0_9STRA|mmetsp:Transcript_23222/g.35318  ORF Transcript_23222/g.35318 Transcript_23222/m.35318 type:complete len:1319 (+) Transcript_23222:174-4130(+)|eukprot:CAMPEP_0194118342 /NCGR_PEP_ID=MMETSP0150-20130528/35029_1 /TAXON_ID=122233 /ORGANISM="Chaetoceros debilis, Strain MM31A-1" /LENGTH=1318 /DNA_ID=CAMNT_0038809677 /DNA_START=150 /DNA_END=4106 /DNA_ORIENTATION=+